MRDREQLELARPHPHARTLGVERAPAQHAALLRQPDADVHPLQLGIEPPRELEILEDPLPVRRALDESRFRPALTLRTEVERELLEELRTASTAPGTARAPRRPGLDDRERGRAPGPARRVLRAGERQLAAGALELAARQQAEQACE